MTQVIYKYEFDRGVLTAPHGKVMLVGQQHGNQLPTLWLMHPPATERHTMARYTLVPTGQEFDPTGMDHVGSAVCGSFVWHVFRQTIGGREPEYNG